MGKSFHAIIDEVARWRSILGHFLSGAFNTQVRTGAYTALCPLSCASLVLYEYSALHREHGNIVVAVRIALLSHVMPQVYVKIISIDSSPNRNTTTCIII